MKSYLFKYGYIFFTIFVLFSISGIKSQDSNDNDSIIRIQRTKTFLISNSAPQYIVEIRNDTTISFYNILPDSFTEHQSELIKNWIIDSTTIKLESSDFNELIKTVKETDFENIDKIDKHRSENGIEMQIVGKSSDDFLIEFKTRKVEFSIVPNNEKNISESARMIGNIIKELEEKYKPKK